MIAGENTDTIVATLPLFAESNGRTPTSGVATPTLPFAWHGPAALSAASEYPGDGVLTAAVAQADKVFGLAYGLDDEGVGWLERLLVQAPQLHGWLVLALYPACATSAADLRRLLLLQESLAGRLRLRLLPLPSGADAPATVLCCLGGQLPNGLLSIGPSPNFGLTPPSAVEVNLAFSPDPLVRESWVQWFTWLWDEATVELSSASVDIPSLVPARGDPKAAELWEAYLVRCHHFAPAHVEEQVGDAAVELEANHVPADTPDGEVRPSVADELGIPLIGRLERCLLGLSELGAMVTIDKQTRIPPVDAPIKPEWLGVESFRQVGMISRETKYRISVIDDTVLKEIERRRKKTRELLDKFSYPLGDGARWMPTAARELFDREMDRENALGQDVVRAAVAGNADTFVDARREQIVADLQRMHQEVGSARPLDDDKIEKVVGSLKERLRKASEGKFLPTISPAPVRLGPQEGGRWTSSWGQSLTLLLAVAEYARNAIADPFFFRGVRASNEDDVVTAMDVLEDVILAMWSQRGARDCARHELELLTQIHASQLDDRQKCEMVLDIIQGRDQADFHDRLNRANT